MTACGPAAGTERNETMTAVVNSLLILIALAIWSVVAVILVDALRHSH